MLNAQGDVVQLRDSQNRTVANYHYDAWGKLLSITDADGTVLTASSDDYYPTNAQIAFINPIRYRGYVYDNETGFYYVSSRYYDPEIGRWINADGYVSTGQDIAGYNMFAYCGNNSVNRKDPTGQFWITALIVTVVVGVCTVSLSSCSTNKPAPKPSKSEPYSNQANCYAYAMKLENDPRTGAPFQRKPQPGEFSGNGLTTRDLRGDSETVKSNINQKVSADAKVLNLNYIEVSSADHIAKPGNWVVALAYATDGSDYHWYRRNDDGTWSHKPGSTPIISWDASGHAITDPKTCDRGIYNSFLGYYEVGPN